MLWRIVRLTRFRLMLCGGFIASAILLAIAAMACAKFAIDRTAERRVSDSLADLEPDRVALVLGCSKTLTDGRPNLFFQHRVEAAKQLFEAGKVDYLLVSGDNSRKSYNEPEDMKTALVSDGVPSDRIVCDYAGFSTLDSTVRAREVFGLESFIVVSQGFHARRAVYIATQKGIDAQGYAANDVTGIGGMRTLLREHLARVKTVLDVHFLGRQPRHLGEQAAIGSEGT
ncbi:MAG: vancomycin high temperature exclusion protein [Opitutales bacterium]